MDLLIASAGGHLAQLGSLASRLPYGVSRRWVTYDVPQVAELLAGEDVTHAFHPTTKSLRNALRNYRLARHVFAEEDVERVISTGAAVAVPFMMRARQLGIPCHYIESATRVTGPSLSGRILERLVPGVHLYRQMGSWGAPRWRQGPCVFDGYAVSSAEYDPAARPESGLRVLVSMGTHKFPFSSLVTRLQATLPPTADVTWQLGSTLAPPGLRGRVLDHLSAEEFETEVQKADVVVGHAGVGLTLTSLAAGKVPVLVPRRRSRREHTDDHQVQLARALRDRGLAGAVDVRDLSSDHLRRAVAHRVHYTPPPEFTLID